MRAAEFLPVNMKLKSLAGGRTLQMTARTFSNLLSLARLEGWRPARLPEKWPTPSSDTEFILQELSEIHDGLVSKADARGLSEALSRVAKNAGGTLGAELSLAITDFNTLLGRSGFLVMEKESGDTVMFTR